MFSRDRRLVVEGLQAGNDQHDAEILNRQFAGDVMWGRPYGTLINGYVVRFQGRWPGAGRARTRSRQARLRATCAATISANVESVQRRPTLLDENISRSASDEKCCRKELMSSRVGCWKG